MKILTEAINDLVGTTQNLIIILPNNLFDEYFTILHRKLEIIFGEQVVRHSLINLSYSDSENTKHRISNQDEFEDFVKSVENSLSIIQAKIIPKSENLNSQSTNFPLNSSSSSGFLSVAESDITVFKKYQKKKFIDAGAFGSVYKVKKEKEKFALKVIDAEKLNPSYMNALLQEVFITTTLHHANIVKTRDVFFDSNKLCIEMDWVPHGNLWERIKRKDIGLLSTVLVLDQMVHVLSFLKEKKMVHRDIKPNNIMVDNIIDDYLLIKLGDFGLARRVKFLNDHPFRLEGTMNYLSPEIMERMFSDQDYPTPYTYSSDIFALGVTIFQLLTFDYTTSFPNLIKQSSPEKFYKWIQIQIETYCPEASPQLISLIVSMLNFDPRERISCEDIEKLTDSDNFTFSTNQIENRKFLEKNNAFINTVQDIEIDEEILEMQTIISEEEPGIDPELLEYIESIDLDDPELLAFDSIKDEGIENDELRILNIIDVTFNDVDEEIILLKSNGKLLVINQKETSSRRMIDLKNSNATMISCALLENERAIVLVNQTNLCLIDRYGNSIWSSTLKSNEQYCSVSIEQVNQKIFLLTKDSIHIYSLRNGTKMESVDHPIFMHFNSFAFDQVGDQFYIERDGKLEIFTPGLQYISHFIDTYEKIAKIDVDSQAKRVVSLETTLINITDSESPKHSSFSYEKFDSFCLDRKNRNILAVTKGEIVIFQY